MSSLSAAETKAVLALADAWNALLEAVPNPISRIEAQGAIHQLQAIVLAQPTMRANPSLFRDPAAYLHDTAPRESRC